MDKVSKGRKISEEEKNKAKSYIDRFKSLKNSRHNWEEHWQDVARYIIPNKENVWDFMHRAKGEKKNLRLYDSSARHYNELLASALHSMLTNPSVQWFELTTGDRELDKDIEVREYLQKLVRKIHQILNNSNFQTEIHEMYLDLGSFGTGAMLIDEDDENVVRFTSRPIYQFYLEENYKKQVDTFFLEVELTARQLKQKYGEEVLPAKLMAECIKKPSKKHKVCIVLHPNTDREYGKKDAKNKPYKTVHIYEAECAILKESGFEEFPAAFPRWMKDSMETYGRSPGMKALPEIKMANAMMKTIIRSSQKIVDPPLMIPDDGFMKFNTMPGGLNPYRAGTDDRVYPIETRGNIVVGLELLREVKDSIKQSFYIDQLQLREGPQMTATEVNARTDEHLRLLGPILGRLHFELLHVLIARVMGIMQRKGLFPEGMPEKLADVSPEVYYSSQIARAQRISELQNWDRFMASTAALTEVMPEIMDKMDPDKVAEYLADIHAAPHEVFRTPDEVEDMREQRAEQEQQMQQTMLDQEQAKTTEIAAKAARE